MAGKTPVRIIKREQRALAAKLGSNAGEKVMSAASNARQVKEVVSSWVRERQQSSMDARRAFNGLFQQA